MTEIDGHEPYLRTIRGKCLLVVFLGWVAFLFVGLLASEETTEWGIDFRSPYYAARATLKGLDPYLQRDLLPIYDLDRKEHSRDTIKSRRDATRYIYPPTLFLFTIPLSLLPYTQAHALWLIAIAGLFLFAAYLMWLASVDSSPQLGSFLIFLFLVNSPFLIYFANPAGIAVSLCVIGCWCIIQGRFERAGATALALSLMMKPHDAGFVWLYFVFAGGAYRKRAIQSAVIAVVLSVPLLTWTSKVSPTWIHDMRSNLMELAERGDSSDPGPTSITTRGTAMLVCLQRILSLVCDEPRFYNPGAYLIGGPLLLLWIASVARSRPIPNHAWFALASVSALGMLPFYHRMADTKLLILVVPACALLEAKADPLKRIAIRITVATVVLTGDLFWLFAFNAFGNPNNWSYFTLRGRLLIVAAALPAPLALLTFGVFFLAVFRSRSAQDKFAARVPDAEYS